MEFHRPVMVSEVVAGLVNNLSGTYVDATAGGGGHSVAILKRLARDGRLIAIDRDPEAIARLRQISGEFCRRTVILQGNFRDLPILVQKAAEATAVSGILFDLGVSSHQIDEAGRGFSYRKDGPLDMRMDRNAGVPAVDLLAQVSEVELSGLISRYGEERGARRIARAICSRRDGGGLKSTGDLRAAVESTHPQMPKKTLARVFQALRIAVNDELNALESALSAALKLLTVRGRLAVITYHSLEDRLVKSALAEAIKGCTCPPRIPVCMCGRKRSFRPLHLRRTATEAETDANSRARSAGLRVFEKLPA